MNSNQIKMYLENNFEIIDNSNIYHYYLDNDFEGLYINSVIDSIHIIILKLIIYFSMILITKLLISIIK